MILRKLDGHRGLDHGQNFLLGYELALCDQLIVSGKSIKGVVIHAENLPSVVALLKATGRKYRFRFLPDDKTETMVLLYVKRYRDPSGNEGGSQPSQDD